MHGDNRIERAQTRPCARELCSPINAARCANEGCSRKRISAIRDAEIPCSFLAFPAISPHPRLSEEPTVTRTVVLMTRGSGGTHVSTSRSSVTRSSVARSSAAHPPARRIGAPYDRTRYAHAGGRRPAPRTTANVAAHHRAAAHACCRGPTQNARPTYVIDADLRAVLLLLRRLCSSPGRTALGRHHAHEPSEAAATGAT